MVQEFSPLKSHSAYLSEALAPSLGQGLGSFLGNYQANKSLQAVLNDPELKNAPVSQKLQALTSAMNRHGRVGQGMLQNQFAVMQQEMSEKERSKQLEEQAVLGKFASGEAISAQERAKLTPKTQIELQKLERNKKQAMNMKEALKRADVPDELSEQFGDLYEAATEGGKTELLKQFNELFKRGKSGYFKNFQEQRPFQSSTEQMGEWPEITQPMGMTPSEEIKLQSSREKHNLPIYEETNKILSGLEDELRDIQRLQQLEERGNLPEGLDKWDINWETGEPRFSPALLPPDAQLYLKTIASMLGKAKEFFPGRVTNFDLDTFRKRFPTLANSKEGRILIQKQLELANRIAYLREDLLKQAMEHYGAGADPIQIRKIADKKYKEQKQQLEERLKNLDGLLDNEYQKNLSQSDQKVPQGNVKVKSPDGKLGYIPENQLKEAMKAGYERL